MDAKTTTSTSFTLIMSMMGASLLSCSFIVYRTGAILGVVLYVVSIIVVMFLVQFFLEAVYYLGAPTYRKLAEMMMGRKFSLVLDIAIDIQYYGFVTAYIIICSNAVQTFILNIFKYSANAYIIKAILSIVIIFPLCLPKSLKTLSKIASVAGLAIFITAFSIFVYFFMFLAKNKTVCTYTNQDQVEQPITYAFRLFPDTSVGEIIMVFFQYIPSFVSNFGVYNIIPNLLMELQGPPQVRKKVLWVSVLIANFLAFSLYTIVGFLGAYMFGDQLKDNVLSSFAPCKFIWVDILSLIYAFVVIIAYPMVLFPIKVSLVGLTKYSFESKQGQAIAITISALYVLASMGLAMAYESIVTIFGLFAALTSFFYIFLLPTIAFIRFPQIKSQNRDKDLLHTQDDMVTVDPVSVAVLSMLASSIDSNTVERARAFSTRIFGGPEVITNETDVGRKHAFSILRPRTFSIKQEDDGTTKLRTVSVARLEGRMETATIAAEAAKEVDEGETVNSLNTTKVEQMHDMKEQGAIEVDEELTVEEIKEEHITTAEDLSTVVVIPLGRKIVGYGLIVVFGCICLEGVVVNLLDIIKAFA